jgi:hypothetical protein
VSNGSSHDAIARAAHLRLLCATTYDLVVLRISNIMIIISHKIDIVLAHAGDLPNAAATSASDSAFRLVVRRQ